MKAKLIEARDRIKDRKNWCTGALARNDSNDVVDPNSPFAEKWCAVGTLARSGLKESVLFDLAMKMYKSPLSVVNDCMGHREVMDVFDAAIGSIDENH